MLWAAIFYIIFVGINIMGIEITMRFTVVITIAALGILAFFFVAVLVSRSFDASLLTNIPPEEGGSSFLPKGIAGIFPALPFAIWFYLAIEELPLGSGGVARSEARHSPRDDLGAQHAGPLRHFDAVPEHRCRGRSRGDRYVGDPVVRRLQGGVRGGHGGGRACVDRADRA